MHYEQTIIPKCFALPKSKYTDSTIICIQGDINKYTLYMYLHNLCKSCLFSQAHIQISYLNSPHANRNPG